MFFISIPVLLLISFLLAYRSLRNELKKPEELERVERELKKEKVLFVKD